MLQATVITLPEPLIIRSLDEYHRRVQEDNQWYFSKEAVAYRMSRNAYIWLHEQVSSDELQRMLQYCLDMERRNQERGVPESLRTKGEQPCFNKSP